MKPFRLLALIPLLLLIAASAIQGPSSNNTVSHSQKHTLHKRMPKLLEKLFKVEKQVFEFPFQAKHEAVNKHAADQEIKTPHKKSFKEWVLDSVYSQPKYENDRLAALEEAEKAFLDSAAEIRKDKERERLQEPASFVVWVLLAPLGLWMMMRWFSRALQWESARLFA